MSPLPLDLPAPEAPAADWGAFAVSIPGWQCRPDLIACLYRVDPDHWAWEGWLRRMLGNHQDSIMVLPNSKGLVEWHNGDDWDAQSLPMGRACIAAAHALGRWPGGDT